MHTVEKYKVRRSLRRTPVSHGGTGETFCEGGLRKAFELRKPLQSKSGKFRCLICVSQWGFTSRLWDPLKGAREAFISSWKLNFMLSPPHFYWCQCNLPVLRPTALGPPWPLSFSLFTTYLAINPTGSIFRLYPELGVFSSPPLWAQVSPAPPLGLLHKFLNHSPGFCPHSQRPIFTLAASIILLKTISDCIPHLLKTFGDSPLHSKTKAKIRK